MPTPESSAAYRHQWNSWREWLALRIAPWLINDRKNWWSVVKINADLAQLLTEHHAVGAMDGALIGDKCRVCERAGVLNPSKFVHQLPTEADPRLSPRPW